MTGFLSLFQHAVMKVMKGAFVNLKKCKLTTKIYEQEKVPTINLVCDRIFTVVEELDAFIKDRQNRGSGVMFARQLKIQIEFRFPDYGTDSLSVTGMTIGLLII